MHRREGKGGDDMLRDEGLDCKGLKETSRCGNGKVMEK